MLIFSFNKDEQLFVLDPLALHHIVVKDQYVYEETDSFIVCVLSHELLRSSDVLSILVMPSGNRLLLGVGLLSTLGAL